MNIGELARQIADGQDPSIRASVLDLTTNNALAVALVDATGAQITSLTVDSEFPAAAALGDNTANPTTTAVASFPHWFDGATWDRARGDSTDGLLVNLGSNNDVVVSAADLDIRNLVFATDKVDVSGSTGVGVTGTFWQATQPVSAASLPLPTGASTLAEQQTQTTHLATIAGDTTDIETAVELIDDAIVTDDAAFTPATTKVMMAGFEYDDTSPDSVNEGDGGAARMSANRNIYTTLRDAAGNERGANVDAAKNLKVSLGDLIEGENQTYHRMMTLPNYSSVYIATATTTTVKSGAGVLHLVVLGETAAGAITLYDNTAGSGTILAVLKASIVEGTYIFDIAFSTGLTIVTAGASKLTVSYI